MDTQKGKQSKYETLITLIRSGQLNDLQVAEELKDENFRKYYQQQVR